MSRRGLSAAANSIVGLLSRGTTRTGWSSHHSSDHVSFVVQSVRLKTKVTFSEHAGAFAGVTERWFGSSSSSFAGVTERWLGSSLHLRSGRGTAAKMKILGGRALSTTIPSHFMPMCDEDGDLYEPITYPECAAEIRQHAPDFRAAAVVDGEIIPQWTLSEEASGKWTVLVFYPKDFTFVCPTELIAFSDRHHEFQAINAQVVGISTDTEETHLAWCRTPRRKGGLGIMNIPLIADTTKYISAHYGVLLQVLHNPSSLSLSLSLSPRFVCVFSLSFRLP